jgi:CheY-specific phosphatase CheX
MSCPSSAPPLPHGYDPAGVADALITVAERSFFAYAEAVGPEGVAAVAGKWYQGSVTFVGPFSGRLTLALPVALARDLSMAFLGLEPDAVVGDVEVCDLVGELSNMVCGSWLTGLPEQSCFELTHPEVRLTEMAAPEGIVVAVNEQPVVIHLEIAAGER